MAASGINADEREARVRAEAEREGATLGPQIAVPDHLGERQRHQEAPALHGDGAEPQASVREIEAQIARAVVVANDEDRGAQRRLVVAILTVVDGGADAEVERTGRVFVARPSLDAPARLVDRRAVVERNVARPLLTAEQVDVEVAVLVLRCRPCVLGRGRGHREEGQTQQEGAGDARS